MGAHDEHLLEIARTGNSGRAGTALPMRLRNRPKVPSVKLRGECPKDVGDRRSPHTTNPKGGASAKSRGRRRFFSGGSWCEDAEQLPRTQIAGGRSHPVVPLTLRVGAVGRRGGGGYVASRERAAPSIRFGALLKSGRVYQRFNGS